MFSSRSSASNALDIFPELCLYIYSLEGYFQQLTQCIYATKYVAIACLLYIYSLEGYFQQLTQSIYATKYVAIACLSSLNLTLPCCLANLVAVLRSMMNICKIKTFLSWSQPEVFYIFSACP